MTNSFKNLMILLAFFTGLTSLHAQSLSVGIRGGINLANVSFEDEPDIETDNRMGLDFGLLLNFGVSESFSIQPEIHYMQKGYRIDQQILGQSIEQDVLLNYLELPILAKLALGNESIKVLINAGPSIGYALNGKLESDILGQRIEADIDFSEDEEGEFNRLEFSMLFGTGLSFDVGAATIFADVRYLLGLTTWGDLDDDEFPAIRNRGLGLGLGLLVPVN
ncbi:MAG: PorT family protein [bacterium]|nr:PorT family protein [bacterium]